MLEDGSGVALVISCVSYRQYVWRKMGHSVVPVSTSAASLQR